MTAACSPLPLTLACQDDPYNRNARAVFVCFPPVSVPERPERLLETTLFGEPRQIVAI